MVLLCSRVVCVIFWLTAGSNCSKLMTTERNQQPKRDASRVIPNEFLCSWVCLLGLTMLPWWWATGRRTSRWGTAMIHRRMRLAPHKVIWIHEVWVRVTKRLVYLGMVDEEQWCLWQLLHLHFWFLFVCVRVGYPLQVEKKSLAVVRDSQWWSTTDLRLAVLASRISSLSGHDSWRVRKALVTGWLPVLLRCHR